MDNAAVKDAGRKKSRRQEVLLALALASPFLIIFIIFTVLPVILGVVFSFMEYNPLVPDESKFIGLGNFLHIFDFTDGVSLDFWRSFLTMFVFAAVAVPCLIIIPLALAYFVNMQPPGYKIFRALIYLPSVVSISIMGILFGNIFAGDSSGLLNAWLGKEIHWLGGKPWHGDTLRWVVMLLASIWWQSGTNFVIFSGALKNVPKSLYEACEMDGGGKWKSILYVTLPNIKTSVSICLFTTLIGYLALYGQPYTLSDSTNSGEYVAPMMFIQSMLSNRFFARQTGYICAAAIVFGLISMIFGGIQRVCMTEKKHKNKFESECGIYLQNKILLAADASPATEVQYGFD